MSTMLSAANMHGLSSRELEVLSLILEGNSSKEAAKKLYLSKRTIDFHLARIYDKLGVSNRVQAIRRVSELGLLTGKSPMLQD